MTNENDKPEVAASEGAEPAKDSETPRISYRVNMAQRVWALYVTWEFPHRARTLTFEMAAYSPSSRILPEDIPLIAQMEKELSENASLREQLEQARKESVAQYNRGRASVLGELDVAVRATNDAHNLLNQAHERIVGLEAAGRAQAEMQTELREHAETAESRTKELEQQRNEFQAGFVAANSLLDDIDSFVNKIGPVTEKDKELILKRTHEERPYAEMNEKYHLLDYYTMKREKEEAESELAGMREALRKVDEWLEWKQSHCTERIEAVGDRGLFHIPRESQLNAFIQGERDCAESVKKQLAALAVGAEKEKKA